MATEREYWVAMNDGVRLDVSVCTPAGPTPAGGWPGILLVHGHGDTGSKAATLERGRRYAGRGYLAVCYSVRGQGGSEGLSFHLFEPFCARLYHDNAHPSAMELPLIVPGRLKTVIVIAILKGLLIERLNYL